MTSTATAAPRVTIIGGGSVHWSPRLLADFCNTPSLCGAHVVLHDLDHVASTRMAKLGTDFAARREIPMRVEAVADVGSALRGADAVISAFSVGGLDSMRYDIEVPQRYGIRQPIGDSVGPGGVARALRSVPVVLQMGRDVETHAPGAWFINVSNPLSALTRTIARETNLRVVGLCNELLGLQFQLSLLFDVGIRDIDFVVGGVNHFPIVTQLRIGDDDDGFQRLRAVADDPPDMPLWMEPPSGLHWRKVTSGDRWTKRDVVANLAVKLELFRRFGVLPGANDHHIVEFMPGFVHPDADHGAPWHVRHWGIEGHRADVEADIAEYEGHRDASDVTRMPSGELVAAVLDGLFGGSTHDVPVNLPNQGQVTSLPGGTVVECMGVVDTAGVRPRGTTSIPGIVGEYVRRAAVSQELTVEAALLVDRDLALGAMLADPIAGRLPYEQVVALTNDMIDAIAPWISDGWAVTGR